MIVLPYKVPSPEAWRLGPWTLESSTGQTAAFGETELAWDPSVSLSLRCDVDVDCEAVFAEAGLAPDAVVQIHAVWWVRRGRTSSPRTCESPVLLGLPGSSVAHLSFEVDGYSLGGAMALERRLVLLDPGSGGERASAQRHGSILLREEPEEQILEGVGAQYPTTAVSFSEMFPGSPNAPWLHCINVDDLDAPAEACVHLYLNSDHPASSLLEGVTSSPVRELLDEALRWDVSRQTVVAALMCEDLMERWSEIEDDGSIGALLKSRLQVAGGGAGRTALGQLLQSDPSALDARLQSGLSLFRTATAK